jgi:hypothetical protein
MKEKNDITHRLIIGEWLTLAGIFIGCFVFLLHEIRVLEAKQDTRICSQEQRTDQLNARSDQMNARTDQLYQIIIDLLKERK